MLILASSAKGTPVLSLQASASIADLADPIIDPETLQVLAFFVDSSLIEENADVLMTRDIREFSFRGAVIDGISDLVDPNDIVKLKHILSLNFALPGLKVKTESGRKLGTLSDFTFNTDTYDVMQLIVTPGRFSSLLSGELTISRNQITKIDDYTVTVQDSVEKVTAPVVDTSEPVLGFTNPFRRPEPAPAEAKLKED